MNFIIMMSTRLTEQEYNKLKSIYNKYFSLQPFDLTAEEKSAMIYLICGLTLELRGKKPTLTPYELMLKISKSTTSTWEDNILMCLDIICNDFISSNKEFPDFGLKTQKEKVTQIREFFNKMCPF